MRKAGDYSDFKIGEIYPDTLIKIESDVYKGEDKRTYVDYTCTACNSGIIYRGRTDRIRSGRTCRCVECGRRSKRPEGYTKDVWVNKEKTVENVNLNNLTGKHLGEIRGEWFINSFDHTTNNSHGHTYYICINTNTGEVKSCRLDHLPHEIDNRLTNLADLITERKNIILNNQFAGFASSGELAVGTWLKEHNIAFESEYTFPDLKGNGDGLLRFDFKIKDKPILIEFQGQQHYEPVDFFGGEKQFQIQQFHDDLKKKYCKYHGYTLVEIPYNYKSLDTYLNQLL